MKTLVMKFGGTSVGSADAMRQAADIVRQALVEWPRLVVVSSAMSGVTDVLLESARRAAHGDTQYLEQQAEMLRKRHHAVAETLLTDPATRADSRQEMDHLLADFVQLGRAIAVLGEATPRALDAVASLGERLSIRLLASILDSSGTPARFVEATHLVITNRNFQDASPDWEQTTAHTRRMLEPLLQRGIVPVISGFIGATPEGIVTTLGRGGSDFSAAILGAVLPADEVWIWTDVNGVMTADPRLAPDASTIPELSFKEVSELAYYGAKVLHPKTIRPVIEAGIGLRVLNTFNPTHPGTRILRDGAANSSGTVKAVTIIRKQQLITIEGRGMLGVPGVAGRSFHAVAATGTSVPLITQASSEQSICFAVPAESTGLVIDALKKEFSIELAQRNIDDVWATGEVAIITVVGAGMRHTTGIAGKVFTALGDAHVNVMAIAQGSSEVSISLVVASADAEAGVRTLHTLCIA